MKTTEHNFQWTGGLKRLWTLPLLCGLLAPALRPAQASDAYYVNNGIINYPLYQPSPPVIAATNFINNNEFTVNYTVYAPFFQTSDTENYTNNAAISINTGFKFDRRSSVNGNHSPSVSFNNQGGIYCAEKIIVNATNILSPGSMETGLNGLIQLAGENVDLTRTFVNIQGSGSEAGVTAGGTGTSGLNTNYWDPSFFLQPTSAESAVIWLSRFNLTYLTLTNSEAYIEVGTPPGSSNNVIRAVFLQDDSLPNVSHNVYIGPPNVTGANGAATIEWVGTYVDPASGNTISNYLYLNNNYIRSTATNLFFFNGIPDNFNFASSDVPIAQGVPPTVEGFLNVFPNGAVTNRYSYADAQLISSSVDTNSIANRSVTNLPGRVEISANKNLKLANAVIAGMNYMSVQSSNQFDGSAGATIQVPYADINVGVTNGFLTLTNLMSASIPNWSGAVQAWSTAWTEVANGVTNDYGVLIVRSQLQPQSPGLVQDLILHGTNTIVVSDAFNIMRTFTADARNLTLTTNGFGTGATSLAGELNVGTANIFWASALPNLRNLTNDGAIRLQNLAQFMGTTNIDITIPSSPAIAATGLLSQISGRTNVLANNSVTIGTNQYVFVSSLASSSPANRVKIASTFDGTLNNLIAAINRTGAAGAVYSSKTTANPFVSAGQLSNHAFTVTARVAGVAANLISTTLSAATTNLTWSGYAVLQGGADAQSGSTNVVATAVAYENLINHGLISDQGTIVNAGYFENSGMFTNGAAGNFNLQSQTSIFTNGSVYAVGGDISIAAENLLVSNVYIQAGKSLSLVLTTNGWLTDGGVTNGNTWSVGGATGSGLFLPVRPAGGDLLGTTITNIAPTNKVTQNVWSARDLGATPAGFENNQAVGRLVLNSFGMYPQSGVFAFSGSSVSNALYIDYLELEGTATNRDVNGNVTALQINTNLVIYYAQAVQSGQSVAQKINGKNNNRLRWVSSYAGYYSSTNMVYPPGVTNAINQALATSTTMDSDGDGVVNAYDSTPVLVPGQLDFGVTLTNRPPLSVKVQWITIPNATNYIYYRTNLASGAWLPFTNFNHYYYGANIAVTNAAHVNWFASPQNYPSAAGNVWVYEAVTNVPHFYQITVQPWTTYPF